MYTTGVYATAVLPGVYLLAILVVCVVVVVVVYLPDRVARQEPRVLFTYLVPTINYTRYELFHVCVFYL